MTDSPYRIDRMPPGYGVGNVASFDCGSPTYTDWLRQNARSAVKSRSASVYLLIEESSERVVGYFTVAPTQVTRDEVPEAKRRQLLRTVPGYLIGKLARDRTLQNRWRKENGLEPVEPPVGGQLVLAALAQVVRAADRSGGRIIGIDADNDNLIGFYERCGFRSTGVAGSLRLYMKVATAVRYLAAGPPSS